MAISIEVNKMLESILAGSPDNVQARIRQDLAVSYYQRGVLSFNDAVELSGGSRFDFEQLWDEQGSVRNYIVEDSDRDLQWGRLHT